MRVLILWAPLADYTVGCFKQLSLRTDLELHIIYQHMEKNAPYDRFDLSFFKSHTPDRNGEDISVTKVCQDINPDIVLMSSWNYRTYMSIAKTCRKKGAYVISTFDGQWEATLKQRIGILISPFFLKPSIDNFFVPGDRQATFARKLGYPNPMQGYYCANSDRFSENEQTNREGFIFVGRLIEKKGIKILINAYKSYRESTRHPWSLTICGTGPLADICDNIEGVNVIGFTQPGELSKILYKCRTLILPSHHEPWGLVIHEAALAGLSIICSYKCGASTHYVREGLNGSIIDTNEIKLTKSMLHISNLSEERRMEMSITSRTLGMLWTTEKWANYVYDSIKSNSGTD